MVLKVPGAGLLKVVLNSLNLTYKPLIKAHITVLQAYDKSN